MNNVLKIFDLYQNDVSGQTADARKEQVKAAMAELGIITEALKEARPFVDDMVGIASFARFAIYDIDTALKILKDAE